MKYILNFDLSILNIFQVLKINGFENYLISKYGNVFQCKVNILRIYLFEDKLKMNNWNRLFINIVKYKFTMEFIKERGICLKINIDLFLKCENYISCKDIFGK